MNFAAFDKEGTLCVTLPFVLF